MVYGYGARLEIRLGVERKSVDVEEFYNFQYSPFSLTWLMTFLQTEAANEAISPKYLFPLSRR